MKRLHVHIGVDALAPSIAFYSHLFGAGPTVSKDDYAKWMLDDPRVNFAISTRANRGVAHLGIEAETSAELDMTRKRLAAAGQPVLDEGTTTCCYARSTKQWVADPQGVAWESFLTLGGTTDYGAGPAPGDLVPQPEDAVRQA